MKESNILKILGIGTAIILPLVLTPTPETPKKVLEHTSKIYEKNTYSSWNKYYLEKLVNEKEFYNAIMHVESRGNPQAYRKDTKATGLFQITPIVLKEWNENHREKYNQKDIFNHCTNTKIANWYMKERLMNHYFPVYNIEPHPENLLTAWNWGIGNLCKIKDARTNFNKLPNETKVFIKDVLNYYENNSS
jgi:soluble lytic murein transglycosylase-like protein